MKFYLYLAIVSVCALMHQACTHKRVLQLQITDANHSFNSQLLKHLRSRDRSDSEEHDKLEEHDNCECPRRYNPVCDSKGVTHKNRECYECSEKERDTWVLHKGPCTDQDFRVLKFKKDPYKKKSFPFPCVCTDVESPVCDTDGDTHYNYGCMKCAKPRAMFLKFGTCIEDEDYIDTGVNSYED